MKRQVLYLNWDGFASYYYEAAAERGIIPVLEGLREQGVFFEDARCGVPPITNPMQTAIASGAYSEKTRNVKLYYDRARRQVIAQRRENAAEHIVDALWRQGRTVASVHHFTFEENGTYAGDPQRPYVFVEEGGYRARFRQLLRLYAGEPVCTGGQQMRVVQDPDFTAVYFDDLDTVGHNNGKLAPVAENEAQRVENVLWRLSQMDAALGEFLQGLKNLGIYDRISFFLVTDHGMAPFSFGEESLAAYRELLALLEQEGYRYEVLGGGESPQKDTDIVLASAGLSLMLSFTKEPEEERVQRLKKLISEKSFVGGVMDAAELRREGSMPFCDLYISPAPPFIFREKGPRTGANHDSLDDSARRIFSLIWGSGIQKNVRIKRPVRNIDFASTMTALLGAEPPRDNMGRCITEALEEG